MTRGPPFHENDSESNNWTDWRENTTPLDYPDRDIRIIFHAQRGGTLQNPKRSPAEFGDFDPQPDDPDPDIWPLEEYDPAPSTPVKDLILTRGSFPAPHVAWVTEEYLEAKYGYNPARVEVDVDELPEYHRPERWTWGDTVEIRASDESPHSMTLTDDRSTALDRIARLWNGEQVRGNHLLLDKCPDWMSLFDDLDQEELRRLVVDPRTDAEFVEAFADHDWFEDNHGVYAKPQRILRKKVWYAPTQRGRTLITEHADFPNLIGDPLEGLRHRVTVGLAALMQHLSGRKVATYHDFCGYNVDIVGKDDNGQFYAGEVLTGHHNNKLHRSTYDKLADLHSRGVLTCAIFDSRDTAIRVLNHWHKNGLGELPLGTFDSRPSIEWGREKINEAYANDDVDWKIYDWMTTDVLWRKTLGQDGPDVAPSNVTTLNW